MNDETITEEDLAIIYLALREARGRYLSVPHLPELVAGKVGKELMDMANKMFRVENKVLNYLDSCREDVMNKQ